MPQTPCMPVVAVIGASRTTPDHPDFAAARRLGHLLAEAGLTVASGGYAGLMEAVSEGAASAGGTVIGVTAPTVFPSRPGPNRHVSVERPAETITERIHDLIDMADAVIALPGSLGTLTELVMAWNVAFVAQFSRRPALPVVAVGEVWRQVITTLAERLDADRSFVTCVETVDQAAESIVERTR